MSFTDFLGHEVNEGDTVLYAGQSGRSVQMIKAKVLTIREKSVTVEPQDCARWNQHYGREKYLDDKGKPFDPYGPKGEKHRVRDSGYVNKETGKYFISPEYPEDYDRLNWQARSEWQNDWHSRHEYVLPIWADYVRIEKVPVKVTLTVFQNIVKIADDSEDL